MEYGTFATTSPPIICSFFVSLSPPLSLLNATKMEIEQGKMLMLTKTST